MSYAGIVKAVAAVRCPSWIFDGAASGGGAGPCVLFRLPVDEARSRLTERVRLEKAQGGVRQVGVVLELTIDGPARGGGPAAYPWMMVGLDRHVDYPDDRRLRPAIEEALSIATGSIATTFAPFRAAYAGAVALLDQLRAEFAAWYPGRPDFDSVAAAIASETGPLGLAEQIRFFAGKNPRLGDFVPSRPSRADRAMRARCCEIHERDDYWSAIRRPEFVAALMREPALEPLRRSIGRRHLIEALERSFLSWLDERGRFGSDEVQAPLLRYLAAVYWKWHRPLDRDDVGSDFFACCDCGRFEQVGSWLEIEEPHFGPTLTLRCKRCSKRGAPGKPSRRADA